MLEVSEISKNYKNIPALNKISFNVGKGEMFGIIGPDGAGKTSLIRILTTLLIPNSGYAKLDGLDVVKDFKKIRKKIGYMPSKFSLYQDLSVYENLSFFASVFGTTIDENYDLIKDIYQQIEPFANRLAGKLSGGMKQKLALSCALIHRPDFLFLDEPTTGVDAVSRKEFWQMLATLKKLGISILVSTPYMDEATLCDRVMLIQKGNALTIDSPAAITAHFPHPMWSIKGGSLYKIKKVLEGYEFTHSVNSFGQDLHYVDKRTQINITEIRNFIQSKTGELVEVNTILPNIEDCFIEYSR
ncbi:MAG: ABC transporter ATP-binding protein [Bacteroidales bacterium]|nr:ABC transporter ATP-binding protein [Bacteroidales bacterium]